METKFIDTEPVYLKDDDGYYTGWLKGTGAISSGKTIEEAKEGLFEAMAALLLFHVQDRINFVGRRVTNDVY